MKRPKNTKTKLIEKKGQFQTQSLLTMTTQPKNSNRQQEQESPSKDQLFSSPHLNYITIRLLQTEITQPTDPFSVQQKSQPLFPQLLT